jgi:hypothetical protein
MSPLPSGESFRQAIHMQAGPFCLHRIEELAHPRDLTRRNGMGRRSPPRKVMYFEPVPPRLARNTIIR